MKFVRCVLTFQNHLLCLCCTLQVGLKCQYISTRLHCVTTHNMVLFILTALINPKITSTGFLIFFSTLPCKEPAWNIFVRREMCSPALCCCSCKIFVATDYNEFLSSEIFNPVHSWSINTSLCKPPHQVKFAIFPHGNGKHLYAAHVMCSTDVDSATTKISSAWQITESWPSI